MITRAEVYSNQERRQEKDISLYYRGVRSDLLTLFSLPKDGAAILELGCGSGGTLCFLKDQGRSYSLFGIESFHDAVVHSRNQGFNVIEADIEKLSRNPFGVSFDLIIMADVLEHLANPWAHLAGLRNWLNPGGRVLASVPNVKYIRIMRNLLFCDSFRYEGDGLLDKTHLHLFTQKSLTEIFSETGYEILRIYSNVHKTKYKILNLLTLKMLETFFAYQYFIEARTR